MLSEKINISDKLVLRTVSSADLDKYFDWQRDKEASYMAAFLSRDPSDRDAFDKHMSKILADDSVIIRTVVCDGIVVGQVGSFLMNETREVTYWIDKAYWGQGIATAALRALLHELKERPLYGCAARDNHGSLRVLEKCGFKIQSATVAFAKARQQEIEEVILRLD